MESAAHLLQVLLAMLALNGTAPDDGDAWRGWVTFKQFARVVDEIPDPGVSVQVLRHGDDSTSLVYLRQLLQPADERLEPVGGVVMEFWYPTARDHREWDIWSLDHETFEAFVDRVEQHEEFAELVLRRALWSDVYWQHCGS